MELLILVPPPTWAKNSGHSPGAPGTLDVGTLAFYPMGSILSLIIVSVPWAPVQSLVQARQEMLAESFHSSLLTTAYTGSPGHTVVANAIRRPRGNGQCSAVPTVLNIDSQLSLPCFLRPLCRRGCSQPLAMLVCFSLSPGFQKERVTRVKCAPHPTSL